jgi:hypothetical protein
LSSVLLAGLTVAAGVITSAYATTGLTGIPFAFLAVAVVLGLFVPGYVAMTRHITNAGAFYAFIATRPVQTLIRGPLLYAAEMAFRACQQKLRKWPKGHCGAARHEDGRNSVRTNLPEKDQNPLKSLSNLMAENGVS